MEFGEYQKKTREFAFYPGIGNNFSFPVIGLAGETGEVAEKIKKLIRDKNSVVDEEVRAEIEKEIGDVMWYLAQLASELGISLDDAAENNIKKIQSRKERGVTHGNGDNR